MKTRRIHASGALILILSISAFPGVHQDMVSGINIGFAQHTVDLWVGDNPANDCNPAFVGDLHEVGCQVVRYHQYARVMADLSLVDSWTADVEAGYMEVIKISNQSQTDPWITIPALVPSTSYDTWGSNDYLATLGDLLNAHLDPARKVYVEYSNEVWNNAYEEGGVWDDPGYNGQYTIVRDRGAALGFDDVVAGPAYTVFAATECWKILEDKLGDERVINVLAGWQWNEATVNESSALWAKHTDWGATNGTLVQGLENDGFTANPQNIEMEAFATNPYFHEFSAEGVQHCITGTQAGREALDRYGYGQVLYVGYEGGQHLYDRGSNYDPQMYDYYTDWLQGLEPYLDLNLHYAFTGQWGSEYFHIKENTGDPLDLVSSQKARALHDYYGPRTVPVSPRHGLTPATAASVSVMRGGTILLTLPGAATCTWSATGLNGTRIPGFSSVQQTTDGTRVLLHEHGLPTGTYIVDLLVNGTSLRKAVTIAR
ncbi:MAG: hypothetical protein GF331_18210 [Chitinivibrionales bacterium]|nr:hypothetical protein [Chitinivibrionales bacterium]